MPDRDKILDVARLAARLDQRHRAVAEAYVRDPSRNLVDIAREAGFSGKRPNMRATAKRILARGDVGEYLRAVMAAGGPEPTEIEVAAAETLVMDAEEVKRRLTALGRVSLADVMEFGKDGVYTGSLRLTKDSVFGLRELKQTERYDGKTGSLVERSCTPKIEDRQRALQAMGQVHGIFKTPTDARRDEVVAAAWARVFEKHPEIAEAYHFALLEAERQPAIDVTPVKELPVNGNGNGAHG